jgi:hypothetical protein
MLFYLKKPKYFLVENVLSILLTYAKVERFQISPLRTTDIFEKIVCENTVVICCSAWK